MIEAAAEEMAGSGWAGVEVRAYSGACHIKHPDGGITSEWPKPIKEWTVTFFFILKPGLTTVKAIGKGKTLAAAITQAKEKAYAYDSRH